MNKVINKKKITEKSTAVKGLTQIETVPANQYILTQQLRPSVAKIRRGCKKDAFFSFSIRRTMESLPNAGVAALPGILRRPERMK